MMTFINWVKHVLACDKTAAQKGGNGCFRTSMYESNPMFIKLLLHGWTPTCDCHHGEYLEKSTKYVEDGQGNVVYFLDEGVLVQTCIGKAEDRRKLYMAKLFELADISSIAEEIDVEGLKQKTKEEFEKEKLRLKAEYEKRLEACENTHRETLKSLGDFISQIE